MDLEIERLTGSDGMDSHNGTATTPDETVLLTKAEPDDIQKRTSFEKAILLTEHGKFYTFLLFGCGSCLTAMIAELYATGFVIPAAQCEFEMDSNEKGLLNAICYIGMISSSHMWGYLADTKGRRRILIIALLLDGICAVFSSFAHAYWVFVILRFFNGFFICAPSAVVFAHLGEFHPLTTRTSAILKASIFQSLGGFYTIVMTLAILTQEFTLKLPGTKMDYNSWRVFLIAMAIPSFVASFLIYLLPESPKYLLNVGKHNEALHVLRYVFTINTGRKPEDYPVTRLIMDPVEAEAATQEKPKSVLSVLKNIWSQTAPLFKKPYVFLTTLAYFMQFILYMSYNGFSMWLPEIFNRLKYGNMHPNDTLTICGVVEAVKEAIISHSDLLLLTGNNRTVANTSLQQNLMEDSIFDGLANTKERVKCMSHVNPTLVWNLLAMVVVCMVGFIGSVIAVRYVNKKLLMMGCLLLASICGTSLYFAAAEWLIVALAALLMSLPGACVNVLNSIIIESIPTQFRAMSVCLSMMFGRLGVAVCTLLIGMLLETTCWAVFAMLSGSLLLCAFLLLIMATPSVN